MGILKQHCLEIKELRWGGSNKNNKKKKYKIERLQAINVQNLSSSGGGTKGEIKDDSVNLSHGD